MKGKLYILRCDSCHITLERTDFAVPGDWKVIPNGAVDGCHVCPQCYKAYEKVKTLVMMAEHRAA